MRTETEREKAKEAVKRWRRKWYPLAFTVAKLIQKDLPHMSARAHASYAKSRMLNHEWWAKHFQAAGFEYKRGVRTLILRILDRAAYNERVAMFGDTAVPAPESEE